MAVDPGYSKVTTRKDGFQSNGEGDEHNTHEANEVEDGHSVKVLVSCLDDRRQMTQFPFVPLGGLFV